jgi:hypothetical protein
MVLWSLLRLRATAGGGYFGSMVFWFCGEAGQLGYTLSAAYPGQYALTCGWAVCDALRGQKTGMRFGVTDIRRSARSVGLRRWGTL